VELSSASFAHEYERDRQESLGEYIRLKNQVRPLVPEHLPLLPGTVLGPSNGEAHGACGDFAWCGPWTCFITDKAYGALVDAGVQMPVGVPAELRWRGKARPPLLELSLEPRVPLTEDCFEFRGETCPACGYPNRKWNKRMQIRRSQVPGDLDVFRVSNHTTIILANERFRQAVIQLGLNSISFEQVEIVEDLKEA
jgi:uncharacterized double-CXXCG motif protein